MDPREKEPEKPMELHEEAFLRHARENDAAGARHCLEMGVDPDVDGAAALQTFVEAGNYEGVKALFDFDINPHINNGKEYLTAVQRNCVDIVVLMLKRAPSLSAYEDEALMIASLCAHKAPNVLTAMLENASFSNKAKNNALVHAAYLNCADNMRALCANGAALSGLKIDDIRTGLRDHYWSDKTIGILSQFPQNVPMLYVAARLFDRPEIERLHPVARVSAFNALLGLEDTLRDAPEYMPPAIRNLTRRYAEQQMEFGRITADQLPAKKAEAMRGLFNWVGEANRDMRNAILQAVILPEENPTRKFTGFDTADPFALDY